MKIIFKPGSTPGKLLTLFNDEVPGNLVNFFRYNSRIEFNSNRKRLNQKIWENNDKKVAIVRLLRVLCFRKNSWSNFGLKNLKNYLNFLFTFNSK